MCSGPWRTRPDFVSTLSSADCWEDSEKKNTMRGEESMRSHDRLEAESNTSRRRLRPEIDAFLPVTIELKIGMEVVLHINQ